MYIIKYIVFASLLSILISCGNQSNKEETTQQITERPKTQFEIDIEIIQSFLASKNINATATSSGLYYVIHIQGDGPQAQRGSMVTVHYEGKLMDGTKFDSSYDRGEPLTFQLGVGAVIPGWEEGIALLKKGSLASLFIPSNLAYGERGFPGLIPANAVLRFDIDLVDVQ